MIRLFTKRTQLQAKKRRFYRTNCQPWLFGAQFENSKPIGKAASRVWAI